MKRYICRNIVHIMYIQWKISVRLCQMVQLCRIITVILGRKPANLVII